MQTMPTFVYLRAAHADLPASARPSAIDRHPDLRDAAGHPHHRARHPLGAARRRSRPRSRWARRRRPDAAQGAAADGQAHHRARHQPDDHGRAVDGDDRRPDRRARPRPDRGQGPGDPRRRHRVQRRVWPSSSWRSSWTASPRRRPARADASDASASGPRRPAAGRSCSAWAPSIALVCGVPVVHLRVGRRRSLTTISGVGERHLRARPTPSPRGRRPTSLCITRRLQGHLHHWLCSTRCRHCSTTRRGGSPGAVVLALAYILGGLRVAITTAICLALLIGTGLWYDAMVTLAATSGRRPSIVMLLGIVVGVWMGRSSPRRQPDPAGARRRPDHARRSSTWCRSWRCSAASRFTAIVAAVVYAAPVAIKIVADGIRGVSGRHASRRRRRPGRAPWQIDQQGAAADGAQRDRCWPPTRASSTCCRWSSSAVWSERGALGFDVVAGLLPGQPVRQGAGCRLRHRAPRDHARPDHPGGGAPRGRAARSIQQERHAPCGADQDQEGDGDAACRSRSCGARSAGSGAGCGGATVGSSGRRAPAGRGKDVRHRQPRGQPVGRLRGRRRGRRLRRQDQARLQRQRRRTSRSRCPGRASAPAQVDADPGELGPRRPDQEVHHRPEGRPRTLGQTGNKGIIGWYVPPWMAEKYPDITDWKNLNKYADHVQDLGVRRQGPAARR